MGNSLTGDSDVDCVGLAVSLSVRSQARIQARILPLQARNDEGVVMALPRDIAQVKNVTLVNEGNSNNQITKIWRVYEDYFKVCSILNSVYGLVKDLLGVTKYLIGFNMFLCLTVGYKYIYMFNGFLYLIEFDIDTLFFVYNIIRYYMLTLFVIGFSMPSWYL